MAYNSVENLKGGKQAAEKVYQQQIEQLRQEFQVNQEEWQQVQQSDYNLYSDQSAQIKAQELANLKTVILAKEEAAKEAVKKEEEMKKQAETLAQAAEIEKILKENLSQVQELAKAEKILQGESKAQTTKTLLAKLEKLPALTSEEQNFLSQLYLTVEQFAALASQAQYLTQEEQKEIRENFPEFSQPLKLGLINSGLNNLGLNTAEKKQNFVELNHTLYQEKAQFGLTIKEKENILRLLITITAEQKNDLLKFAVEKVNLTEEQKQELAVIHSDGLKTFSLNEKQENLMKTLAPLIKEDKYSEESLKLLKTLSLKSSALTFFINEKILPNPNLDFGEVKDTYLPLKTKFLSGEQKVLIKQKEQTAKQANREELIANKQSILNSLLDFAET
ncbi:954_t:CDS:2 [Ambispora gerdemannii]|uniref:954_t:CDS:1 n=1 Tax=Ambispora gerdemannii TaxID=144530 RepID=A0A9N9DUQ0_9GLOM|nr:954_t:CDS:2 [Ambispora gerdemannii]